MNILTAIATALLVPVWIFAGCCGLGALLKLSDRSGWWVLPLYMALGVPLALIVILGTLGLGAISIVNIGELL